MIGGDCDIMDFPRSRVFIRLNRRAYLLNGRRVLYKRSCNFTTLSVLVDNPQSICISSLQNLQLLLGLEVAQYTGKIRLSPHMIRACKLYIHCMNKIPLPAIHHLCTAPTIIFALQQPPFFLYYFQKASPNKDASYDPNSFSMAIHIQHHTHYINMIASINYNAVLKSCLLNFLSRNQK
jgi:hypothetical protein